MGAYEDNLRHIAEPAAPSERDKATTVTLDDWVALWFAEVLREYAHYVADEPHDGIAVGLASHIDKKVRDHGKSYVPIYAHTNEAVEAIERAAVDYAEERDDSGTAPHIEVSSMAGSLRLEFIDKNPKVVELNGEKTVVYDEDDAEESLAMKEIGEAESEAERKQQERLEQHWGNNGHF
jgi:hypothetical protein